MSTIWRTVRIFISSTFRDMQAERDWLVKRVFPALRQRLEPHRIHLVDIDLRWGITREQAENDQVLGLCLQQIDECRPFFVGLLGGRYGWVPSKFPVEVGKCYGWTQAHTGKSVTELEILHGVLNDPAMLGRALFCFRSEKFLDDIHNEQQRFVFVEGPTDEELRDLGPKEAERRAANRCQRLADLKNEIRALSPPMPLFDGYSCAWDKDTVDPATKQPGRIGGLAEFGNWVIEKLERAILDAPELREHLTAARTEARDELAEERDFHERFIENRTRVYIGRHQLQHDLKAFVASNEAMPCLVTGPSGSGKSAALAKFVSVWRAQHPQETVIIHFVGASPRSTSLREMLRHLCAELKDTLKLEDEIKQDVRELSDQFRELLSKVPADRRVVLVLDALDQLDETDNAHSFYWLPRQIPSQVRLIVSCIDDPDRTDQPALAAMRSRQPHEIRVGPLTDEERLGIVREVPSVAAKTLDEQQIKLLLKNEATRNPLFLLAALEELRGFGSFDQLNQRIAGLPQKGDTLTAIFQQVIQRLGTDFNATTVKAVLTLMACSRHGLSERELLDLLEGESVRMEESVGDLFHILRQLRPYLQSRGSLLDFFHRHLAKATQEEFYKADEDVRITTHRKLANYFRIHADPDGNQSWKGKMGRPFGEMSFHLTGAQRIDELYHALCDLRFVEARCRLSQVFESITDYRLAQENLPEAQAELCEECANKERAQRWTAEITEYARQWSHRRGRMARGDTVSEQEPTFPEIIQSVKPWSNAQIKAECKRIMENPTRLDRLHAFAGFVEAECYPLLEFGNRPSFVAQHAFNTASAGLVHEAAYQLLSAIRDPVLLRHWLPDELHNPKPALLRTLTGHSGQITGVSVTSDGGRAVSGGEDATLRVWDLESGQCLRTLAGHKLAVWTISVTPDGRRAVSVSVDGTLRVWDLENGRCLRTLAGHDTFARGVSMTPDSRRAVVGSSKVLLVWDLQNGQCLHTLKGHSDSVRSVSVTPDGRRAVSGSEDNTLRVWDLESGQCLRTLEGHSNFILSVSVMPDGRRAVSGGLDNTLRLWDLACGQCLCTLEGHTHFVRSVSVTPDGRRVVSGGDDRTLRVWDLESGQCLRSLGGYSDGINSVSVTPDGRRAVSGSEDGTLQIWDLETGQCLPMRERHSNTIIVINILPDSQRVVSGSADRTLRVWDLKSARYLRTLAGHKWAVNNVSIAPDNQHVVSASGDGTLRVWNLETGQCLRTLKGHKGGVDCVSVTPDSRCVVSGGYDKTLRIWNLVSGQCLRSMDGHSDGVECVSVTPEGRRAVSGSRDNTLRVWDLESGQCLHTLEGYDGFTNSLSVTPDGRRVVSGGDNNTLRVWDLESGKCLRSMDGHSDGVECVSVTPEGLRAVSGSFDGTMRVWDLESGQCMLNLERQWNRDWKWSLNVTRDGCRVVTAHGDRKLCMWDLKSGQCIGIYFAPSGIRAVALGNRGNTICIGTVTGDLFFIDVRGIEPRPDLKPYVSLDTNDGGYEQLLRRGLELSRHEKGCDHKETLAHLAALAVHLEKMGKSAEARAFVEERGHLIEHKSTNSCKDTSPHLQQQECVYKSKSMTEDPALLDAQARELYTRKDLAGALKYFEEALRIRAARISTHPNDLQNLEEWARSSICYGVVLNDLGRFDEAFKAYEVSLPVYRQLLESDPANARCLEDLFVCCTNIAGVLRQMSRPEAKEWWQRARLAREAILQYGRQLPAQSEKEFQELRPTLGDAPESPSKGPNPAPKPT